MLDFKISKFKAENFRNLDIDNVDLHPNLNFIYGDNGNGKTNFLESIHIALTGKSFKKNVGFPQLISFDGDNQELLFNYLFKNDYVSGKITPKGGEWYKNGQSVHKKKLVYPIVFIGAHDPHLFFSSPQARRDAFDDHIFKVNKIYEKEVNKYKKFIKIRNKLISFGQNKDTLSQIIAIDKNLSQIIPLLIASKIDFIFKVKKNFKALFLEIFQENHEIELILNSKFKDLSEKIVYNYLQDHLPKDFILGYTGIGPHRDDFEIQIDGLNVLDFASLGQQKIIYLSLVFSSIRIMQEELKVKPIILMDDLSNEIDNKRWKSLIEFLINSDFQVLITSANRLFLKSFSSYSKLKSFEIVSGKILSTNSI